MRAISALSLLAGMSTRVCLADTPLRRRVSMSEIGSVITPLSQVRRKNASGLLSSVFDLLPGTLGHAGHIAFECQLAEAQAAHVELAQVGTRAPAALATVAVTNLVFQ